jgi:translation initiation factor 3 subunit B
LSFQSFRLQENKSLKVTGIRDFTWSPSDNIIAYWVAENKDVPARVVLIEVPSRNEIRAKNLFSVADCRMHWQKSGDYLCVKVDRYSKTIKKDKHDTKYSGMYYNFEVFHLREKQVPVDSVEVKEPIIAFAWEPVGSKFAIIHGEPNTMSTSFWGVKKGDAPLLLSKFVFSFFLYSL